MVGLHHMEPQGILEKLQFLHQEAPLDKRRDGRGGQPDDQTVGQVELQVLQEMRQVQLEFSHPVRTPPGTRVQKNCQKSKFYNQAWD